MFSIIGLSSIANWIIFEISKRIRLFVFIRPIYLLMLCGPFVAGALFTVLAWVGFFLGPCWIHHRPPGGVFIRAQRRFHICSNRELLDVLRPRLDFSDLKSRVDALYVTRAVGKSLFDPFV